MNPPTVTEEAPALEVSDILTAHDRCDTCGSQAYVLVLMEKGELNFCGHHFAEAEDKLANIAVKVVDERYKLAPRDRRIDASENAF